MPCSSSKTSFLVHEGRPNPTGPNSPLSLTIYTWEPLTMTIDPTTDRDTTHLSSLGRGHKHTPSFYYRINLFIQGQIPFWFALVQVIWVRTWRWYYPQFQVLVCLRYTGMFLLSPFFSIVTWGGQSGLYQPQQHGKTIKLYFSLYPAISFRTKYLPAMGNVIMLIWFEFNIAYRMKVRMHQTKILIPKN